MVFLVTFLSINKKVITWRLLVEGSRCHQNLNLAIGIDKSLTLSPSPFGEINEENNYLDRLNKERLEYI